jgi:hypothetical protein
MFTMAHRLGKMDRFSDLMRHPESVEDPMLAAVAQACADSPEATAAWGTRLGELAKL